jgi:diguanylate cyclase (GGDEF)-like protein
MTSLTFTVFTSAVAGGLLLTSWLQHRNAKALLPWGLAFLMAAAGTALVAGRGVVPDIWSIVIANAVLALAYGAMWSGVRVFEGRRLHPVGAVAGAVIWPFACSINAFYSAPTARAALMAAIGIVYTLLAVIEFWRARADPALSRRLIMIVLTVHALSIPFRIPLVGALVGTEPADADLVTFVTFESMLVAMCGAYLFGSLAKDRIALRYKQASLVDPLTGAANRRAFLKQGARLVLRARRAGRSVALLLFDLDHFKSINDGFGHSAGDSVLTAFCRVASEQLRPTDLFARMGGEEFACLLPDTSREEAVAIAERVRAAVEATVQKSAPEPFTATVSIGAAVANDADSLASLLAKADHALYRAKQNGRNRVELAYPTGARKSVAVQRSA